jgi:hypothetical protein
MDTLEPLMFALALGSAIASTFLRGEPNIMAVMIAGMSYFIAVSTRWKDRSVTCRGPYSAAVAEFVSKASSDR